MNIIDAAKNVNELCTIASLLDITLRGDTREMRNPRWVHISGRRALITNDDNETLLVNYKAALHRLVARVTRA